MREREMRRREVYPDGLEPRDRVRVHMGSSCFSLPVLDGRALFSLSIPAPYPLQLLPPRKSHLTNHKDSSIVASQTPFLQAVI